MSARAHASVPLPLAGGVRGGLAPKRRSAPPLLQTHPRPLPRAGGETRDPVLLARACPRALSLRLTAVWLVGLALTAPHAHAKARPAPPSFAAALPPPAPAARAADGAIYNPAAGYPALYEGLRARRVGDPVTIVLDESATSSKTVNGKTDKTGNGSITPPSAGLLSFLNPNALKASSASTFKGGGSADQTNSFKATLAVTIAELRPNGTALVRGEKQMLLSQGDEWIRFAGIIRLADVDADNAVPSSRVADARLEYAGKGALQRASRPGWLSRLLGVINPF